LGEKIKEQTGRIVGPKKEEEGEVKVGKKRMRTAKHIVHRVAFIRAFRKKKKHRVTSKTVDALSKRQSQRGIKVVQKTGNANSFDCSSHENVKEDKNAELERNRGEKKTRRRLYFRPNQADQAHSRQGRGGNPAKERKGKEGRPMSTHSDIKQREEEKNIGLLVNGSKKRKAEGPHSRATKGLRIKRAEIESKGVGWKEEKSSQLSAQGGGGLKRKEGTRVGRFELGKKGTDK